MCLDWEAIRLSLLCPNQSKTLESWDKCSFVVQVTCTYVDPEQRASEVIDAASQANAVNADNAEEAEHEDAAGDADVTSRSPAAVADAIVGTEGTGIAEGHEAGGLRGLLETSATSLGGMEVLQEAIKEASEGLGINSSALQTELLNAVSAAQQEAKETSAAQSSSGSSAQPGKHDSSSDGAAAQAQYLLPLLICMQLITFM